MPSSPANSVHFLERYRDLIDDWPAFWEAVHTPMQQTIWTNTLRTTPAALAHKLPVKPISWFPGAFRFTTPVKAATLLPYLAGHYQIQEEAAMLPALLMQPQPGETILDLCAAPGNKSVQIAVMMQSSGLLVANDRSRARLDILRRSISRLGLTNVGVTVYDATSFTGAAASYDRILADVPCTGEGTIRRAKNKMRTMSHTRRPGLQRTQSAILHRAIKLCKPGGYVVYATCTFAPEENEAIVDAALRHFEGKVALVPCDTQGLFTTPGLTSWKHQTYHPDLIHAHRLWPHHNDTGGFFVAMLKKTAPTSHADDSDGEARSIAGGAKPGSSDNTSLLQSIATQLEARFGLPSHTFDGYLLHPYGKFMSLSSFDAVPKETPELILAGLPFCKYAGTPRKLKTGAGMRWGPLATKNVIELTEAQTYKFGSKEDITLPTRQVADTATRGYVLLKHKDMYLGLGFLRDENGGYKLESLIPKHWLHTLTRVTPAGSGT